MKTWNARWIAAVAFLWAATPALARSGDLERHLFSEISGADQAFMAAAEQDAVTPREDRVELNQFMLGLSAHASFGISRVVGLEVAPEITLIWQKSDQ